MPYAPTTGDRLLAAWLSLTSTLWNKRLVSTLTYNEAHVLGILLRAEEHGPRLYRNDAHRSNAPAQKPDE